MYIYMFFIQFKDIFLDIFIYVYIYNRFRIYIEENNIFLLGKNLIK